MRCVIDLGSAKNKVATVEALEAQYGLTDVVGVDWELDTFIADVPDANVEKLRADTRVVNLGEEIQFSIC